MSTLAVFPDRLVPGPGGVDVPMDAVPTSIAEGPDGSLYVGELTGFPFPVDGARIYRVPAGGGEPEVVAVGFTNIIDIAIGEDGSAYVLEHDIDTGAETDDWEIELKTRGESDVFFSHIKLAPGAHGGWHSHPGPSVIAVKSGTATFYDDCIDPDIPIVFPAGTGFVEDAECVHILVNEGDVDLEVVVMQIVPKGAPRRFDEDPPE